MTHETPQPERQEQDDGDPAQAFDALQLTVETLARELGGEMTIIRKGVETAFEEFERFQQPADYEVPTSAASSSSSVLLRNASMPSRSRRR